MDIFIKASRLTGKGTALLTATDIVFAMGRVERHSNKPRRAKHSRPRVDRILDRILKGGE